MRTFLRITDQKKTAEDIPIFNSKKSGVAVYVVVRKQENGDFYTLIALDRDYEPIGVVIDPEKTLWDELKNHPAKIREGYEDESYDDGKIVGKVICLDLDAA